MLSSVKKILVFIYFFLQLSAANATHIVGGELNYQYNGGDSYTITLSVIRDCFTSSTPFDSPGSIGIFDSNNNFIQQVLVFPDDSTIIPNTANSPCLITPNNICYTIAYFTTTLNLPARPGGYQIAYQRCCRNNSIANIANVAATGATYYATIPDRAIAPANSNPVFQNLPSTFICRNVPFVFDNTAIDADGDSLVYQMCVPLNGASQSLPNPQPPANPPYANIVWDPPYSFANPLGGVALAIDPVTGILTARPSNIGQFVYGVSVKEYRNGVYLGETRRDFQVNVVNCPKIVNSIFQVPSYQCGSTEVHFQNSSSGALTYEWDFGVASLASDTSVAAAPVFTYPDTGLFTARLVAVSSFNSSCRDTAFHDVNLYPALRADFDHVVNHCNDTLSFTDRTSLNNGAILSWDWDFGDGVHSHLPNTSHAYVQGGNYTVRLAAVSQRGCKDTAEKLVDVPLLPTASFQSFVDSCRPEVYFVNGSSLASTWHWYFGDGLEETASNVSHIYALEGKYDITMIAGSTSNCYDTAYETIDYQQFEFLGHYLPNSFSPNGDGRNDVFQASGATICEVVDMVIFDRWGKKVFQTTDLTTGWDGTSNGDYVSPGVYVYFLQGKDYSRKGTITVIY